MNILYRIACIGIGYLCGCFLTAVYVTRMYTGKDVSEIGMYGNPGMANVMANVGKFPGILVLLGDLAKTVIASMISWYLFHTELGMLVFLYAGLGASLGHCYPFWRHFSGGKAVTTICATIILYSFPYGTAASIAGFIVVLITKYLSIGGTCIPAFFTLLMLMTKQYEAALIGLLLTVLAFIRHYSAMVKDLSGTGKKFKIH